MDNTIVSLDSFGDEQSDRLLVGLDNGAIIEISRQVNKNQDEHDTRVLTNGHGGKDRKSELWGLATHPTESVVATCGGDNIIRIWDLKTQKQLDYKNVDMNGSD